MSRWNDILADWESRMSQQTQVIEAKKLETFLEAWARAMSDRIYTLITTADNQTMEELTAVLRRAEERKAFRAKVNEVFGDE